MSSIALIGVKVNLLEHYLSFPSLGRVPVYLGLSIPLLIQLQPHFLKHRMRG